MVSVCHDPTPANTLYSKHTVIGSALQGAEHESRRPQFSDGAVPELYKDYNPNNFYVKVGNRVQYCSRPSCITRLVSYHYRRRFKRKKGRTTALSRILISCLNAHVNRRPNGLKILKLDEDHCEEPPPCFRSL